MKRIIIIFCLCGSVFWTVCGCGAQRGGVNVSKKGKTALVAYFSATGKTRAAARALASYADADLFEIRPAEPYTAGDLDWRDKTSRSSVEMSDKTSRPAVADTVADWERYTIVYVGFPIWWGVAPTIINTFLDHYDLTGRVLIPFATSGSSGIDGAYRALKETYPRAVWREGVINAPDSTLKALAEKNRR